MINCHKVTKHACTSSWLPLAHSKHHTYHQVTVMNKQQKKQLIYIYIYISHVNVTQTVPDISPLMPMHQDPLLVWYKFVPPKYLHTQTYSNRWLNSTSGGWKCAWRDSSVGNVMERSWARIPLSTVHFHANVPSACPLCGVCCTVTPHVRLPHLCEINSHIHWHCSRSG